MINTKIEKVNADIARTKAKIAELTAKLRDQERHKIHLENEEIVALFRRENFNEDEFAALLRSQRKGKPRGTIQGLPRWNLTRDERRKIKVTSLKTKYVILVLTALIICMGAFCLPVHASEGDVTGYKNVIPITAANKPMIINATWLDDELLRIDVTDIATGTVSSLAIRLGDFIADAGNNPYILIQAADLGGNLSGTIQISNPFYVRQPNAIILEETQNGDLDAVVTNGIGSNENSVSVVPSLSLTPDGTGTVVDNVVTQNDIEFFTVYTEEGNVFFLVIDRQRNADNVYLLNAVTEADLMTLAERSGNPIEDNSISAIPTPPIPEPLPPAEDNQKPEQPPVLEPPQTSRTGNNNMIFILVAVAAIGGAAYYFKIVRPKKNSLFDENYDDEDEDSEGSFDDDDLETYDGGDE